MSIPKRSLSSSLPFPTLLLLVLSSLLLVPLTYGLESRKLDEAAALPGQPDTEIKCGGCSPCGGATCYQSPPPPPPPSPPPPPKKPPSTGYYCPPPPSSSGFIYITGPPGNLYPIDQSYSGSGRNFGAPILATVLGFGLMLLWL